MMMINDEKPAKRFLITIEFYTERCVRVLFERPVLWGWNNSDISVRSYNI